MYLLDDVAITCKNKHCVAPPSSTPLSNRKKTRERREIVFRKKQKPHRNDDGEEERETRMGTATLRQGSRREREKMCKGLNYRFKQTSKIFLGDDGEDANDVVGVTGEEVPVVHQSVSTVRREP